MVSSYSLAPFSGTASDGAGVELAAGFGGVAMDPGVAVGLAVLCPSNAAATALSSSGSNIPKASAEDPEDVPEESCGAGDISTNIVKSVRCFEMMKAIHYIVNAEWYQSFPDQAI